LPFGFGSSIEFGSPIVGAQLIRSKSSDLAEGAQSAPSISPGFAEGAQLVPLCSSHSCEGAQFAVP
jgi:hypothetical protein